MFLKSFSGNSKSCHSRPKLLEGKTALITGASKGIRKGIALKFASEGCNIAFTDLVL